MKFVKVPLKSVEALLKLVKVSLKFVRGKVTVGKDHKMQYAPSLKLAAFGQQKAVHEPGCTKNNARASKKTCTW